jgi:hypothetical protein
VIRGQRGSLINQTARSSALVRLRARGGRPSPDRRHWVIRPDDLLVLDFELVNLRVAPGEQGGPARLVRSGPGEAYLLVTLPPQHIAEKAYFTTVEGYEVGKSANAADPDAGTSNEEPDNPPIPAVVAGWSRLAFLVTDDRPPIQWTLAGVLEAMRELELSVPANALPAASMPRLWSVPLRHLTELAAAKAGGAGEALRADTGILGAARARRQLRVGARGFGLTDETGRATLGLHDRLIEAAAEEAFPRALLRPEPRPLSETETALELPYELFLSPNRSAAWFHATAPAASAETGHTELWHTRLGTRRDDGTTVDGPHEMRTLRAVWTTAGMTPVTPPLGQPVPTPGHANFPYRMSLDAADKHNVMHLSSNFGLRQPKPSNRYYEPRPLGVDLLMLSSLGAWLDSRGAWDEPTPGGLSVEEWRHRATLGRDHYVRVVYRGFLFPFGHRASLVKITERQFHPERAGNPAYLRQRMFLIVREPVRTYRNSGLTYQGEDEARRGEQFDRMMPFVTVRITTRVSPLLDKPESDDIAGESLDCFWPRVGGQPFKFHLVATDLLDTEVELAMPLIFVSKKQTSLSHTASIIPDHPGRPDNAVRAYATATWPGTTARRATVPVLGQRMAFAESAASDDTSFSVQSVTFGAEVPETETYDKLSSLEPRFFPVVRGAEIDVPSLQRIARTSRPAAMVFASSYLIDGFGGSNAGEVFLAADPGLPAFDVKFSIQADRSGGLVTPDLSLSGLSRITGPVSGDIAISATGSFNPSAWFGAITGARLFGSLKLSDILEAAGFDELDKLPRFEGSLLNPVEKLVADLVRLRQRLSAEPLPATAAVKSVLDQLVDPATGSIPALLRGGAQVKVEAQLALLNAELGSLSGSIGASPLSPGAKIVLSQAAASLQADVGAMIASGSDLLRSFAAGDVLPQALRARLEWRPELRHSNTFKPGGPRNLLLAVEAAGESFNVTCTIDDFKLDTAFLMLDFERVHFRSLSGKKPEVDVVIKAFEFYEPLSFIQTLRELIPFDGFSDGPEIHVSPEGISAGFSAGLPNIAVGLFSLENLSLGAGFTVPFLGPPMSVWFRFCERENPARLTVGLFGGGFFVGLTANADRLSVVEGAIEFGAACSVDLGVVAGGMSIMAGLYFKIEADEVTLAGYFRMRGMVKAFGFVTVTLEVYLEMRFEPGSGKCTGTATVSLEVDVTLFSVSVSFTCTKKFAGSNGDPTLAEMLEVAPDATSADWNSYCEAFA